MAKEKIMAWSKCAVEIGKTGESDAMAETLQSVGVIKDRSAVLESSDGETLEMKATGGETVGMEVQEGTTTLTVRVIEPEDELFVTLGLGDKATDESGELIVRTHVVSEEFSVKVTPKNVGAKGIVAPKTSVSIKTGWSEEDGNYMDLTFGILHGAQTDKDGKPYWYKKFVSKGIEAGTDGNVSKS